jgi:uncharacterized protein YfiM (DUF2279 family)
MTLHSKPSRADPWKGENKNLLFAGSAAIAYLVAYEPGQSNHGFWSSVAMGAAKEYSGRYRSGHQASLKDLAWDVTGAYFWHEPKELDGLPIRHWDGREFFNSVLNFLSGARAQDNRL